MTKMDRPKELFNFCQAFLLVYIAILVPYRIGFVSDPFRVISLHDHDHDDDDDDDDDDDNDDDDDDDDDDDVCLCERTCFLS